MVDWCAPENTITFRNAVLSDVDLLEHWCSQPHVTTAGIENWPWREELAEPHSWRLQFLALLNGHPLGFMQILNPSLDTSQYWGDIGPNYRAIDIWIGDESNLGKGYGASMMQLALSRCFSVPQVTAVLIDPLQSNKKAHRFYKRLGFRFIENRLFDQDQCSVFELSRYDWEGPLAQ